MAQVVSPTPVGLPHSHLRPKAKIGNTTTSSFPQEERMLPFPLPGALPLLPCTKAILEHCPPAHSSPHRTPPTNHTSACPDITHTPQKTRRTPSLAHLRLLDGLRCALPSEATSWSAPLHPQPPIHHRTHSRARPHLQASPQYKKPHPHPLVDVLAGGL